MHALALGHSVDVWLVELAHIDASKLDDWSRWLTPDEQVKHDRFATHALKREYLTTRALSRWALSRSCPDVAPPDWRFARTEEGRPFVAGPDRWSGAAPNFNLSNAGGLVACAVSTSPLPIPIGVDVEPLSRGEELLPVASRYFSVGELEDLRALAEREQVRRTVELWTLKEAYLKGRGTGIAVHLNRFGVRSTPEGFRLDADALDGDFRDWQLEARSWGTGFVAAVAVNRGQNPAVSIAYRDALEAMD